MEPMEKLKQNIEKDINELKRTVLENKKDFSDSTNKINAIEFEKNVDMTDSYIEFCKNEQEFIEMAAYKLSAFYNFLGLVNMEQGKMLYRDFHALCTYLESLSFPILDSFQVLCTLIESNIKTGLLEEEKKIEAIPTFQFKMMSYLEATSFFDEKRYTDEEIEIQGLSLGLDVREKKVIRSVTAADIKTLQQTHQTIQQYYFNKEDTYTKDDVLKIVDAFKQLKVSPRFCEAFKTKLNKNIEKRAKEVTNSFKKQPIKLGRSDKEYKEKLKQIKEYYNGYTGEILKTVNEEKISYLAMLMIDLGYDRKDINQFYQDVNRNRSNFMEKNKIDCMKEFYMLYSKIEFYSQKNFELQELLEEAVTYLYETFGCMEEDYNFWYQEFQNILFQLKKRLPNTFDYEYAQAELLLEKEKQKQKEF